jgi:hypothetical protein
VPRQVGLAAAIDGRDEFLEDMHALLLISKVHATDATPSPRL